jgi:hypothetical protein
MFFSHKIKVQYHFIFFLHLTVILLIKYEGQNRQIYTFHKPPLNLCRVVKNNYTFYGFMIKKNSLNTKFRS